MRTTLGIITIVVIATAFLPHARAEHVDDVQSARDHYAKGKRFYDLGRFAEAAKEYEAAYQAKDDPALLFNLGQAHRLAGNYPQALLAYKAYIRNVPDAANRGEVEARITEMQAVVDQQARTNKSPPQGTIEPKPLPPAVTPTDTTTVARTNSLISSPPAERKSIAKKPWFWATLIGAAAVVATGVAVGVVYGKQDPTPSVGKVMGP
jgi:tetratricopeptide (TPR) repeat protein